MKLIQVNYTNTAFTGGLLILFHLSGSYLGGFFLWFYYFLFTMTALSLLHLIFFAKGLRFNQDFSTNHPVKGREIDYTLMLENSIPLPSPYMEVSYVRVNEGDIPQGFFPWLGPGKTESYNMKVKVPWRGVYNVGLKSIKITDLMGLVSFNHPVYHRTFYVYPRVLPVQFTRDIESGEEFEQKISIEDLGMPDVFRSFKKYRAGMDTRYLSWKKLASSGNPYIMEFESELGVEASLFMDRSFLSKERRGAADDCCIECMLAITKEMVKNSLTVSMGEKDIRSEEDFNDLYRSSVFTEFNRKTPAIELFLREQVPLNNYLCIITPLEDLSLLDESLFVQYKSLNFIAVLESLENKEPVLAEIGRLKERGAQITVIESSTEIEEVLRC